MYKMKLQLALAVLTIDLTIVGLNQFLSLQ